MTNLSVGDLFIAKKPTKSDPNKTFVGLYVALGYTNKLISVDRQLIAEILCTSVSSLFSMDDQKVGKISLK